MDERLEHDLKNQLGIVLGFIELLIDQTPETDSRREDMLEIRNAARTSLALLERHKRPPDS